MSSGVSLPSGPAWAWSSLWPVASTAPPSWPLTWPVWAQMTPSQGRRKAATAVKLVWVPPMRNWTSAPGQRHRSLMSWAAWAQYWSAP